MLWCVKYKTKETQGFFAFTRRREASILQHFPLFGFCGLKKFHSGWEERYSLAFSLKDCFDINFSTRPFNSSVILNSFTA